MNVGNTPLIKLSNKLYGKLEAVNPGGSIKDRPVKYILDVYENEGWIEPGNTIIEATSGNTGISLAMMCAERGYKCIIVMPSDMSVERKKMLEFFGAELVEVDAGDFDEAIRVKEELADWYGYVELNQFNNPLNIECHLNTTFMEIINNDYFQDISAFVAGTGTGGTLMGVQKGFEKLGTDTKIVAVEPAESPVMSGGEKGLHGIQGIGDGANFLAKPELFDVTLPIRTRDAMARALKFARTRGILVGVSTGANLLAAEMYIKRFNPRGSVVTILCDRGERYLSQFNESCQ